MLMLNKLYEVGDNEIRQFSYLWGRRDVCNKEQQFKNQPQDLEF